MVRQFHAEVARGVKFETDDPLSERIMAFEEKIGLRHDPVKQALEMHKQWLAQQGKAWDNTPVGPDDRAIADVNVEYTTMADFNKALTQAVS